MYSLTDSLSLISIQIQIIHFPLGVSAQKWTNLCKAKSGKIVEAFQDNIDKEVRAAGPIFCGSLNGKLIEFPETFEEYEEVNALQIANMKRLNLNEMSIPVNGRSYVKALTKPLISKFKEKYDILEIESSKQVKPNSDVLNFISEKQLSSQSKEELCYIMTTTIDENITKSVNNSIFTNQMCDSDGGWWTVCKFERPIFISLAGLCNETPIDKIFSLVEPKEEQQDRYGTFVGVTGWVLDYNVRRKTWTITHYGYKELDLIMIDGSRRPFGKQTWRIKNYICNQGKDFEKQLLLSNCYDDQFTCNDGTCVPLQSRCDKKLDCKDLSDEKECRLVVLDMERYKKDDTPPPLQLGKNLEVILTVDIQNILDIQEVQKILSLKFNLQETWRDSRMQFYNLKEDEELNTLVYSDKQSIWVPSILFSNTKDDLTSKNDQTTFAKVIRLKKGTLLSLETNEDILAYKGSENEIKMSRVYEVDFICDYNMMFYPFDIQTCTANLIIDGNSAKFIDLIPGNLTYSGSIDLAQYYVMDYETYNSDIKGKVGVKVSLTLGRRLLGTILTVYVPSILLNVVGHSTNYFKEEFFEAIVSINLTCMLVLVTLFLSVCESLPNTSYIKMMDYWFIFNLILPFIEVLLHTYMEILNEDDITKQKANETGKVFYKLF